jgi:glyoxylase-like metal-dependent hydrolase (beta-lactamase superfamily II)
MVAMTLRRSTLALTSLALSACVASTHATQPSTLGTARHAGELFAVVDTPGPLEVETVNSTDWAVDRSGLLNLDSPQARDAGLVDGDEPIQVFFHVVRHPRFGTFIIDTGIEKAFRDDPSHSVFQGLVAKVMHPEKMTVHTPLADWVARQPAPLQGVFFTHLHLDHVSGAPDLPRSTPLYAGPGETTPRAFMNMFTQGTIDRALEGLPVLNEWPYQADATGALAVVDVFGDGSLWALWTPGHTPGSTAYLARTTTGPVLFTGDTSHTAWGWEHDVEPGSYTGDHAQNRKSLEALRALVRAHPSIDVRLGHQSLHRVP